MLRLAPLLLIATPAPADSGASWDRFRDEVASACLAVLELPGEPNVEVNPSGSERFGVALMAVEGPHGTDRVACVFDKAASRAEITQPFLDQ